MAVHFGSATYCVGHRRSGFRQKGAGECEIVVRGEEGKETSSVNEIYVLLWFCLSEGA